MDEVLDVFYGLLLKTPQMAGLLSRHAGRGQE
jgi:hypothetical protein